ncbi:MAG TPA: hypothetical protein VFQ61_03260 [Polyangiaceae bacterium]|nr:hypothetical protein [Polyangiaceae bacterium]
MTRTYSPRASFHGAIVSLLSRKRRQRGSTILPALLLLTLFGGLAAFGVRTRQSYLAHASEVAEARTAAWLAATRGCRRQPPVDRKLLSRGFERGVPRAPRAFYPTRTAELGLDRVHLQASSEFGTSIACNEPSGAADSELHEAEQHFRRHLLPPLR